jgi:hypothetical protein
MSRQRSQQRQTLQARKRRAARRASGTGRLHRETAVVTEQSFRVTWEPLPDRFLQRLPSGDRAECEAVLNRCWQEGPSRSSKPC